MCICRVIHTYCPQLHDSLIKFGEKSSGGRGGMVAKVPLLSSTPSGAVCEPRLRWSIAAVAHRLCQPSCPCMLHVAEA